MPAVTRVRIPASVESIDVAFFQLFPNATAIEVDADSTHYTSENGMLFGTDDADEPVDLLLVPEGMEGYAVLPASLANVPACVLSRCTKLSAMIASQAAGSTGDSALAIQDGIVYSNDMKTLLAAPAGMGASVRIASECETIAAGAFWGNKGLKTIVATGAVEQVERGEAAQIGTEAALGADATTAADPYEVYPAFEGEAVDGATVVTAERAAWEAAGFTSFADPATPGDVAEADGFEFTLLPDYTLRVRWAGEGAAPEELTIPATGRVNDVEYTVSTIAEQAFKGQPIQTLEVPEGISAIGAEAFAGCDELESAELPGSVVSIGDAAFKGCGSLADIDLGGGLRKLGDSALEGAGVEAVVLPATVAQVGARALAANESLERVVALGDVAEVSATALADCTGVEVYIPYRTDEDYAWSAGVPVTGNHLMPYGVELSSETLTLHQDESANLLEGGYLEAAGCMDVQFSYNAAPISVDPSTGEVTAKQTGKTTATVNLTLDGQTLASASRYIVVAATPQLVEDPDKVVEGDNHDHEGEEGCEGEGVDAPEISYKDQLFEDGDFYTDGAHAFEEKVINQTLSLSAMDAGISTMSLAVPSVDSYSKTYSETSANLGGLKPYVGGYTYDAATKTLTVSFDTMTWYKVSGCGGSVNCSGTNGDGGSTHAAIYGWRTSRNKLNAIRKLVLNNFDAKNPKFLFSKMMNLEEIEITGRFFSNSNSGTTTGVSDVTSMFEDCPSLRVIPNNMAFPSTVTTSASLFGFSGSYKINGTSTANSLLLSHNQLAPRPSNSSTSVLLTTYAGSDATVKKQIDYSSNTSSGGSPYRDLVTTYHTVTFDNQGGTGGHQTVGQSTGETNKTYTIRVPHGSPIPELIATPTYYVSSPYYKSWSFGGYVADPKATAPKQYICVDGYPYFNVSDRSWIAITSNMTLKALWWNEAKFYANRGTLEQSVPDGDFYVCLVKGNPINQQYSLTDLPKIAYVGVATGAYNLGITETAWSGKTNPGAGKAPQATRDGRPFRGYTFVSSTSTDDTNFRNTAWYDANCNAKNYVYNDPGNFMAMWGYCTVNFYTNVAIDWTNSYARWQNWGGAEYKRETGSSGANYSTPFSVQDVYGVDHPNWNTFYLQNGQYNASTTSADDWFHNLRIVWFTQPQYHSVVSVKVDGPTGADIPEHDCSHSRNNIIVKDQATYNVYITFKDETPDDTITWKINGGYWDNNTSTTADKTTKVRRGNAVTPPTNAKARTATAEYTYTFKGWGTAANATNTVDFSDSKVKANGAATYYAIWTATRNKYTITWKTGLSGAYWGTNTSDTANKTTSVEYGSTPSAPATPAKAATSNTKWTFKGWDPTISKVTGAKTYTATWKVEYLTTWKLGSTDAYWDSNKSDKGDKTKWVESGTTPSQPATPKRDAVAQYTYTFSSWNPAPANITGPVTYTAIWDQTVRSYKTTWDVATNGGCWSNNKSDKGNKTTGEKVYGTVLSGPDGATATRARYTFVGWSTDKNANPDDATKYSKTISVVGATTYYAIFSANNYNVVLKKNDGSDEDDLTGPTIATISARYDHNWTIGAGNVPSRRGYYFLGWDTDPNYKGMTPKYPAAKDAAGKFIDATYSGNLIGEGAPDSATLYAIWNESRYTIVFHENWNDDPTGTGTVPGRIDPLYSAEVEIPTNDLARTGYSFKNWNTHADGSGATYRTRGTYTGVGLSEFKDSEVRGCTVHLYAQWEPNQYIVQYDPNIMISDPDDKGEWHIEEGEEVSLVNYGDTVDIETVFSRPGYEFIGWSFAKSVLADENDTPIVDYKWDGDAKTFTPGSFSNLTSEKLKLIRLYAQWKSIRTYEISFDGNADETHPVQVGSAGPMGTLEMHYGVAKNLPANTYLCNGFTFKGWNTKADGSGTSYMDQALVQDVPGVADGKVKLYAQWAPILNLTSPIDACIEVYIDGMDMYVYEVRAAKTGQWPNGTPHGNGQKDDHEDEFTHGQAALESRTPVKLFIEQIDCIPNLDPENGMARIFPVDGTPSKDSWEDFELEFTAINAETGKSKKSSTEFGSSYMFVEGASNNYYIPAYDANTATPGTLDYSMLLRIPDDEIRKPNTVRYSEGPVKIATLMFTCRVAE